MLMVAKKRIQTLLEASPLSLALFIVTLSIIDGCRKRMVTVATHNSMSPNTLFPSLSDRQA